MSCNTESYKNFRTYELLIVNKLDFTRISHELVNAGVLREDEREKIGNIYSSMKQNIMLVKYLVKERREFEPFLQTLRSDSSCIQHTELAKTITAKRNSKSEDEIDEDEISQKTRKDSDSDSDSSVFTNETQECSGNSSIVELVGSGRERETDSGSSNSVRRLLLNPFQPIEDCQNKQIQKRSGFMLFFLFAIALAILNIMFMPLKFGFSCIKFILVTGK